MLVVEMSQFLERNRYEGDKFVEASHCWLTMLVKCVKFEYIERRNDLKCIDVFFYEDKAFQTHSSDMRCKVCFKLNYLL